MRRKKPKLSIDDYVLRSWQLLNDTEKYFTLLESWLLRGSNEILGERGGFFGFHNPFHRWLDFFSGLPQSGINVARNSDTIDSLRYRPEMHNLALLDLFGYVTIEHGTPVSRAGWQIDAVRTTPLGWATVNHPYMDEGPFTSEVRIGDLPLQVGGSMVYNFDFGDNWLFDVKLEDIEAADPRLKKPKLLESLGQAPEQYPSYD